MFDLQTSEAELVSRMHIVMFHIGIYMREIGIDRSEAVWPATIA